MGASKLLMEHFLRVSQFTTPFSSARFANVAFSDGSLLHGFSRRLEKRQPITAPIDIKRYFVNSEEAGMLCLLSCFLGENKNIFFPNISSELNLISFSEIAQNFLEDRGLKYIFVRLKKRLEISAVCIMIRTLFLFIFSNLIPLVKSHMKNSSKKR